MFRFLKVEPNEAALLAETKSDGITLIGADNFTRIVRDALQEIGFKVYAYVVTVKQQEQRCPVNVIGRPSTLALARVRRALARQV